MLSKKEFARLLQDNPDLSKEELFAEADRRSTASPAQSDSQSAAPRTFRSQLPAGVGISTQPPESGGFVIEPTAMRAPTGLERLHSFLQSAYESAAEQPLGRVADAIGLSDLGGMARGFTEPAEEFELQIGTMPGPPGARSARLTARTPRQSITLLDPEAGTVANASGESMASVEARASGRMTAAEQAAENKLLREQAERWTGVRSAKDVAAARARNDALWEKAQRRHAREVAAARPQSLAPPEPEVLTRKSFEDQYEFLTQELGRDLTERDIAFLGDNPTSGRVVELLDDAAYGLNASGDSAASMEALSRMRGMAERGETFVVRRGGSTRKLIGPEAVDYRPRKGEEYGVLDKQGRFRLLQRGDD